MAAKSESFQWIFSPIKIFTIIFEERWEKKKLIYGANDEYEEK